MHCNFGAFSFVLDLERRLNTFSSLQEIDCIVNQMIQVADYLDWDVTELRPVSISWYIWSVITDEVSKDVLILFFHYYNRLLIFWTDFLDLGASHPLSSLASLPILTTCSYCLGIPVSLSHDLCIPHLSHSILCLTLSVLQPSQILLHMFVSMALIYEPAQVNLFLIDVTDVLECVGT